MYGHDAWDYKGYTCSIDAWVEPEENIKMWHWVDDPDGNYLRPHITPYDGSKEVVELWIDAGCPSGRCVINGRDYGNWDMDSLELLKNNNLSVATLRERISPLR